MTGLEPELNVVEEVVPAIFFILFGVTLVGDVT